MASATGSNKTKHGEDNGGERAAAIYTLIEICKIDDVAHAPGSPTSLPACPIRLRKRRERHQASPFLEGAAPEPAITDLIIADIGHPARRSVFHEEDETTTQFDQLASAVFGSPDDRCVIGRENRRFQLYRCRTVMRDAEVFDNGITRQSLRVQIAHSGGLCGARGWRQGAAQRLKADYIADAD